MVSKIVVTEKALTDTSESIEWYAESTKIVLK